MEGKGRRDGFTTAQHPVVENNSPPRRFDVRHVGLNGAPYSMKIAYKISPPMLPPFARRRSNRTFVAIDLHCDVNLCH